MSRKIRGFCIVLHDVQKGNQGKYEVLAKVQRDDARQYVIAEELYNHQDGSHIHIFIQYKTPRHFNAILKTWCTWWKSGRVQVDQLRGELHQGCKYLMQNQNNKKKDKYYDQNPIIYLDVKNSKEVNQIPATATHQDIIEHTYNCLECLKEDIGGSPCEVFRLLVKLTYPNAFKSQFTNKPTAIDEYSL